MKLSVYFLLFLTCVGGRALRIPNEDVESTSARENTLVGKSDAERNKIKRGEVARLKPEEVAKVRGSMIWKNIPRMTTFMGYVYFVDFCAALLCQSLFVRALCDVLMRCRFVRRGSFWTATDSISPLSSLSTSSPPDSSPQTLFSYGSLSKLRIKGFQYKVISKGCKSIGKESALVKMFGKI